MPTSRLLRCLLGAAFVLLLLSPASGLASTIYHRLSSPSGDIPRRDEVTYNVWIENNLDFMATEDAFNSSLGENGGVDVDQSSGQMVALVNFGNFRETNASPGNNYLFQATYRRRASALQESLVTTGVIPAGTSNGGDLTFVTPSAYPLMPTGLAASQRPGTGAVLNWTMANGVTYHVYRSDLPSGFNPPTGNGKSNGRYLRKAANVLPPFSDTSVAAGFTYWYMIVAEDSLGRLSTHSEEVEITMDTSANTPTPSPTVPTETPTPTNTATSTPTGTLTPDTPTPSPTPTGTPTAPTPTPSGTPIPAPVMDPEPAFTRGLANTVCWQGQGDLFRVQRSTSTDFSVNVEEQSLSGSAFCATFSSLVDKATYHYRVQALRSGRASAWSNVVTSTQDNQRPRIGVAGYLGTRLAVGSTGTVTLWCYVMDEDVQQVELTYEGQGTAVYLTETDPEVYQLEVHITEPLAGSGEFVFGLRATDQAGWTSAWPYLEVLP